MNKPLAQDPQDPQDPLEESIKAPAKKTPLLLASIGVAALAIGLIAGMAIGNAPIKDLETQVEYQKSRVKAIVEKSESDLAAAQADASAQVSAAEESTATKEAELDTRAEELETRESDAAALQSSLDAEVADREANSFGTGIHEVGTDVKAGKYKTAGPNGNNSAGCYYAWKTSFSSDSDIIDNELTKGNATVILKKGQIFEVGSCEDFIKQ